jgi:hypothetical protein
MQNHRPRNKEMVLAARGELDVAIVWRKRDNNEEARVEADSRAAEEKKLKSEVQGGLEDVQVGDNTGEIFS